MKIFILCREVFFDQIKRVEVFCSKNQILSLFFSNTEIKIGKINPKNFKKKKKSTLASLSEIEKTIWCSKQNYFLGVNSPLFLSKASISEVFNSFVITIIQRNNFLYKFQKNGIKDSIRNTFDQEIFFSCPKRVNSNLSNFKNKIELQSKGKWNQMNIFRNFPYFFTRNLKIFKGLQIHSFLEINPLILTTFGQKQWLNFWEWLTDFPTGYSRFRKIGSIEIMNPGPFYWDWKISSKTFLLAVSVSLEIKTFIFYFSQFRKSPRLELCGYIHDVNKAPVKSLCWGGTVNSFLVSLNFDGGISIWNPVLFPLLNLFRRKKTFLFLQNTNPSFFFILGLKKNVKNRKNTSIEKSQGVLKETIIEMLYLEKNYQEGKKNFWEKIQTSMLVKSGLPQQKFFSFLKNRQGSLGEKAKSLINQFTISICESIKKKSEKRLSEKNLYIFLSGYFRSFFFLGKNFVRFNHIINLILLKFLGYKRCLSLLELEFFQWVQTSKKNHTSFKKCILCKRLQEIKKNNEKRKYCPFFHDFIDEYSQKKNFYGRALSEFGKKKNFLSGNSPNFFGYPKQITNSLHQKNIFIQKELELIEKNS